MISNKTSSTVANHHTTLPTLVGLGLALLGPFVFQWFIGPYLEAFAEPVTAVLLGQGFLWLLALGAIAITLYWERKPLTSLGVRSLTRGWCCWGSGLASCLAWQCLFLRYSRVSFFPHPRVGQFRAPAPMRLHGYG